MGSLKTLALAAAAIAVLATHESRAADVAMPPPYIPPPPMEEYGGWYLRGDIGMSKQMLKRLDHPAFEFVPGHVWLDEGGFDSAPFFGVGVGYKFNNWLRADLTAEYRGKAGFRALDRFDVGTNEYSGAKSEWLFLANAFVDLGTWNSVTPFLGAGIGMTQNKIQHFVDNNIIAGGGGFAETGTQWNFAWALHAGLAYDVTPNFTVELGYRYLNLGDARTGNFPNFLPNMGCPPNDVGCDPMVFKNITSHDFKLGVRWMLADMGVSHWQPPISSRY